MLGPVVVAAPGDREAAAAEVWQLRDVVADFDEDTAALLHTVHNRLTAGPDAA